MFDQPSNLSPDLAWMLQSGQAGDSLIAETLVNESYRRVFHLALSILDDAGLAHSAVVKSFLLTLRRAHRYRSDMDVNTWLFRNALRVCRGLLPGRRARLALRALFAPHSAGQHEANSPLPQTMQEADQWLAVDALPDKQRLPLVLQSVHSLTVQEIAKVLEIREKAVQARLEKAQGTLRKQPGWEAVSVEAFSSLLAQGLGERWPSPAPSQDQLDEARRELENRMAARGRFQAAPVPLKKLLLSSLALLLMAAVGAASYLSFPDEDRIRLLVGTQEITRVAQVRAAPTITPEDQPDRPAAAPAPMVSSPSMLSGIPAGFLLDVPEAAMEQTFFDPLDEWANSGPIVLSRVLKYWGDSRDLPGIARTLQPNPGDENVMPYELVSFVDENTSLKAALRMAGDFSMLAHLVGSGYPVILEKAAKNAETGEWMAHYAIAAGYDQGEREMLTLLSSLAANPVSTISSAALIGDWQPFNYIYLVVYPPEREEELLRILGEEAWTEDNYLGALAKASGELYAQNDLASYFAWFNRGTSLTYLDDYQGAAEAYDRAAEIYARLAPDQRPERMLWYQSRPYWAYFYTGRYDDVIQLADETLGAAEDPVLEESLYWRALAKEAKGDVKGAIADLEASLRLNPNFSAGLDQLSRLRGGS